MRWFQFAAGKSSLSPIYPPFVTPPPRYLLFKSSIVSVSSPWSSLRPFLFVGKGLAVEAPPSNVKGLAVAGSPFSTGVLVAERVFRGNGHHGHSRSCVDLMSE
ncbi:unnamed protein product [Cochlearia groenlandica]